MYLKALEIQGFKSFPDKTVLRFGSDMTAIVGPNGSGKSNISDAIRWVLGEQSSKALRGAKMEDVIFSGTQNRPQVGFAEVSLLLDNADGRLAVEAGEVMVTRRYYRSGESEYYLNRQSVRLKDVNELFMDTGLGREGYSNIGQGRIDEILSVKSEDRREIFEEAAGISKYRHRKEETERKLEDAGENLLRVGDKISELELQVEPLRVQAEKAKQYLQLREELRGLEVAVWLDQLEKLAADGKKTEADYASAAFLLEQGHAALERIYQSIEESAARIRAADQEAEHLRESAAGLEGDSQKRGADAAVLRANLENNRLNLERIERELSDQKSRAGTLESQIAARRSRLAEIAAEKQALLEKQREAQTMAQTLSDGAAALAEQLRVQRGKEGETKQSLSQTQAELSAESTREQELLDRQTGAAKGRAEAKQSQKSIAEQADACRQALEEARKQAVSEKNAVEGYTLRQNTRASKSDELQKTCNSLTVELDTARSRIRMFEEMEREYEGFSRAVRLVMQESARGALKNIHGPVSRLLRTRDEYAVAIETALGSSMQSIVVSTQNDGKTAIELLKRRDAGRATFLPMDAVQGRLLQERGLEAEPGFAGVASELIEYDRRYEEIFRNLLGRTVVCQTLSDAVAMAKRYANRFRIVTLDGQVLNVGGAMTGGSASKSSGVISRANELQRLRTRAQQLEAELAAAKARRDEAARAAAEAAFELTGAQERLRAAEDEVLRREGEQHHYEALLHSLQDALAAQEAEASAVQGRMEAGRSRITALQTLSEKLRRECEAQTLESERLNAVQTDQQEQIRQCAGQLARLQADGAALNAESEAAESALAQLQQLQTQIQGDSTQRTEQIGAYERESAALREQLAQAEHEAEDISGKAAAVRFALKEKIDARMQLEAEKTALEKQSQEKNHDVVLLERESARLEQKKNAAELEQKQILDKLWDSYELTNSTAQALRAQIDSTAAAQRRIAELRRKLSALGSPNLGAIEEFARVNERYEYLCTQRDDAQKAKRDLERIVTELTVEMTRIFKTEFQKINTCFGQTFVELFGGGKASLVLEDEENVLACGIEIRVQPPGKQLRTITLLSGGEKAFVAIALYFAILKIRPTPFCMLDEIDAALDDRNVARFAGYLRNLGQKTQFIVITHRRGTMEAADVLYGVTMQEQGVSKMLTMNLDEMAATLHITE